MASQIVDLRGGRVTIYDDVGDTIRVLATVGSRDPDDYTWTVDGLVPWSVTPGTTVIGTETVDVLSLELTSAQSTTLGPGSHGWTLYGVHDATASVWTAARRSRLVLEGRGG